MFKNVPVSRRIILPLALACSLLVAFAPGVLAASHNHPSSFVHVREHYLALGDSLAFGFQRNGDFTHGYVNDLFQDLREEGIVKDVTHLGCPGETSTTFIKGGICPYLLFSSQLTAALAFLQAHAGNVSPVTLDIGANDMLRDTDPSACKVNVNRFNADLAILDANLRQVILPQLKAALTVNGRVTGTIMMMNYYDPFQNSCPNSMLYTQMLNKHLTADIQGFGSIVDVFRAFGGAKTPNPKICTYTWMCTAPPLGPDIHATNKGYHIIADTFKDAMD